MFLWDCALKRAYLYVKMLIDSICKTIDNSPSIFLKKVITFV